MPDEPGRKPDDPGRKPDEPDKGSTDREPPVGGTTDGSAAGGRSVPDRHHERLSEQFSDDGTRADIWHGFRRLLPTAEYLNLGYSGRFQSHLVGSPQRRLVDQVGDALEARLAHTDGVPLLDVGCGRGGPALHLHRRLGVDATGIDLVPYNVAVARRNARTAGAPPSFVVGDASRAPFADGAFGACTAIDAIVYVPHKGAVFAEIERVLRPGGWLIATDLLRRDGPESPAVDAFADAWDMAPLWTLEEYRRALEDVGLTVESVRELGPNSIDTFRRWTTLYLGLAGRLGPLVRRLLARWGLDFERVTGQVQAAHEALPRLRHVMVCASR